MYIFMLSFWWDVSSLFTVFSPLLFCRMEDEAVLDRGASFVKHVCDEEEVEGKIADANSLLKLLNHFPFSSLLKLN